MEKASSLVLPGASSLGAAGRRGGWGRPGGPRRAVGVGLLGRQVVNFAGIDCVRRLRGDRCLVR